MQSSVLDRLFLRIATVTLIFLYLVILAGSVVRATGSGMGCPDWPKCFGYYIPPTDPSQVEFHPAHSYEKGMMIIVNDTLWRATSDFTSAETFNRANWEKYPVHDYAEFYVQQTWTEYVNRLVGALSSFSMTVLLIIALLRPLSSRAGIRRDWPTVVILLFGMAVLAFVVWLGKVVVDTNLAGASITLHMMSALALVSVVIYTKTRVQLNTGLLEKLKISVAAKTLLLTALLLTLAQIVFGTQVRQQIDEINHNMDGHSRETWISQLSGTGYTVHQVTAMLVVLLNVGLFVMLRKSRPAGGTKILGWSMLAIILAEYFTGVFLHNFSNPAFAHTVHLMLAMIVFGVQFALLVRTKMMRA